MFTERSHEKNCDNFPNCNGEKLVYHCVKFDEQFVEVCAPICIIRGTCMSFFLNAVLTLEKQDRHKG